MLSDIHTIHLAEISFGGQAGFIWNRLHEEREDVCEALLKDSAIVSENRQSLQARLKELDDALDRLMCAH